MRDLAKRQRSATGGPHHDEMPSSDYNKNKVENWWKLQRHRKEFDDINGLTSNIQQDSMPDASTPPPPPSMPSSSSSHYSRKHLSPTLQRPTSEPQENEAKASSSTTDETITSSSSTQSKLHSLPPLSPKARAIKSSNKTIGTATSRGENARVSLANHDGSVNDKDEIRSNHDVFRRHHPDPPRPEGMSVGSPSARAKKAGATTPPPSPKTCERRTVDDDPRAPPSSSLLGSVVAHPARLDASIKSILSDDASNVSDAQSHRSQSVATSALDVLLHRIDEAQRSFRTALAEGSLEKQSELAALIANLGEAAVAMRKLEKF